MTALEPIPSHRVLSLMPTFGCTAACKHCGTLSSPKVQTRLSREQILATVREAAATGYGLVVFTGGEATLAGDDLFDAIALASKLDLLTRLVTNAHWAESPPASSAFMHRLRTAGLDEINFSTGDQHARFVPLESVLRATAAALAEGFTPAIMVELVDDRTIDRRAVESHPLFAELRDAFPGRIVKVNESPWMPLNPSRTHRYPEGVAIDATNIAGCRGCDSILSTTTVQADGTIGACCGLGLRLVPELHIGTLGETSLADAMNDAENDVLKRWIRVEGPERILQWASTHDETIEWEGRYAHRCQACLRIYQDDRVGDVIRSHYLEKVPDIVFAEWLLYGYDGATTAST